MVSVMNVADYTAVVIKCRIAKTAGLKMNQELKVASIANNLCMIRVAGALAVMGAMGRNARNRNALDFPTVALSSEYSSVRFFLLPEYY
jgi:hypothetical protein